MELMERRRILLNTPHTNVTTGLQFVTDMVAPLESLVIGFSPIQDLHGYDSPWPAGGGKNLFDKTANDTNNGYISGKYVRSDGRTVTPSSGIEWDTSEYIPVLPNTQYTLSGLATSDSSAPSIAEYDSNKEFITARAYANNPSITITTNASTSWVRISIQQDRIDGIQLEVGSTATSYAPYSNICPISGRTGLDVTITGKNLCMAPLFGLPPSYSDIVTWSTKPTNYTTLAKRLNELGPGDYVISCDFTLVTRNDTSDNSTHGLYLLFNDGTSFSNHNLAANRWGTKTVGATDTVSLPITITESTAGTVKDLRFYGCGINGVGTTGSASVSNFQVEKGSTATAYEPYQGTTYPISWQTEAGTVYGGTIDVTTGLLTVTHALYTFDGSSDEVWTHYTVTQGEMFRTRIPERKPGELTTISGTICDSYKVSGQSDRADGTVSGSSTLIDFINNNYSTTTAWTANLAEHPVSIVCELNTPSTYQLTSQQVLTIKGVNNLSMSGQVKFWTHRD